MPIKDSHTIKWPQHDWAGLKKYIMRAWWEIPEIMGASTLALVGMCMAAMGLYKYRKMDGEHRTYHAVYYVVRPDDPRVPTLKDPVCTVYPPPKKDADPEPHCVKQE